MYTAWLVTLSLAFLSLGRSTRKVCKVPAIGGGEDDGPAINEAFKQCSKHGKVVLDKYYVVDTLLLTEDLDDVEVELSGTGEYYIRIVCSGFVLSGLGYFLVQYTPDIAKWSPQSLYLVYQNASVLTEDFFVSISRGVCQDDVLVPIWEQHTFVRWWHVGRQWASVVGHAQQHTR